MIEATRSALGTDRFEAALAAGRGQTYDEAMEAALRDLEASDTAHVSS
jgi:hypothetical protein